MVISYYHVYEFRAGVDETRICCKQLTGLMHAIY